MQAAVSTSLFIITINAASGFISYQVVSESLDLAWFSIASFIFIGITGSHFGGHIFNNLPQAKVKAIFGYCLIVGAIVMGLIESTQLVTGV